MSEVRSLYTANNSRNLFGLTVLKNNHRDIRRLRKEAGYPSHHGNKVWKSSLVLMDYLKEMNLKKRPRVLEIGCGWGISSIFCAKEFKAKVTGLDIDDSVFPFYEHHAEINGVKVNTKKCSYQKASSNFLANFDLVIGSDICFWDDLEKPLFNLVRRAVNVGARVVITDPGRAPFNQMAETCQQKLNGLFDAWVVPAPHNCSGYFVDVQPA